MPVIWFKIYVSLIPLMIFVFLLHIRSYRQLYESLKERGRQVDGLEIGFWDYGSRGCISKIKTIQSRFGDSDLSTSEKRLITKSKVYYNLGGIGVAIFIIVVVFILLDILNQ